MRVVIGVDSGGSTTRALAVTLEGERVGYGEAGGGNPSHDASYRENIRAAISRAAVGEVVRVVAGIAGFEGAGDEGRFAGATEVPGLTAVRTHVNDAEVAHFGAFGGGAGIVSIQGTGSTILAILEDGRRVKNGDYFHYARAGAVWVGIRATQRLLVDPGATGAPVREAAFRMWGVSSVEGLREAVGRQFELEAVERSRRYGAVAPVVTAAALAGGGCASAVCDSAAEDIALGVRLLGPLFSSEEVPVALIGACGRSEAIAGRVERLLSRAGAKRYRLVEPEFPPVVGAVLMALAAEGVALGEEVKGRLGEGGGEFRLGRVCKPNPPSPLRGRGAGGEGKRPFDLLTRKDREEPLTPAPLPRRGEGFAHAACLCERVGT